MCKFWLNITAGTLTSPNQADSSFASNYDHNLNCTWMIVAEDGFYITLEIDYFEAKN